MKQLLKTLLAMTLSITNIALPSMFANDAVNEEHLINKDAFSEVTAIQTSSQHPQETIDLTLDYDSYTMWHSDWTDNSQTLPQYIVYDLGAFYDLEALSFLPRQSGSYNGDITEMKVYAGASTSNLAYAGTFTFEASNKGLVDRDQFKTALFNATARFVKVEVTKSLADSTQDKFASMAEIRFYGTHSNEQPEVSSVNKTALMMLVNDVQDLKQADYTAESWTMLTAELTAALQVYDDMEATQEKIDAAVMSLQEAIEALVKVGELNPEHLINKSANDGVIVVSTTSEYPTNLKENCLDYDRNTYWHTNFGERDRYLPQSIVFDLGKTYNLTDFTFLPRQDSSYNGDITEMNVYAGDDLDNLFFIDTYTFEAGTNGLLNRNNFIRVTTEATGRYIKLEITKSVASSTNNKHASMAEIRFYGTEADLEEAIAKAKAELNETLLKVDTLNADDYSKYTWAQLATVYNEAQAKLNAEEVQPRELKALNTTLNSKIEALLNITPLKEVLELAEEKIILVNDYTAASLKALELAHYDARELYVSDSAYTQAQMQEHIDNVMSKINALKEVLKAPVAVSNLTAKQLSYKEILLKWDASKNAVAYDVYRKGHIEGAKFEYVKTVSMTSLRISGLKTGKTYTYYVVAKNSAGASKPSQAVEFKTQLTGKPNLSIEQVSKTKYTLKWTKIDGATRYIIYRKRNNDSYKKLLTLGTNDLSYTTNSMAAGTYRFVVKAARYDSKDRVFTKESNSVKVVSTFEQPKVTLKANENKVQVSWNSVEGIQKYEVYMSASKNSKYVKKGTTSKTNYTISSLESGKTYYFKVCGYKTYNGIDVYSPYSEVKSVKIK